MSDTTASSAWRTFRFDELATMVNDRVDDPSEANVDYYVGLEHLDSDSLTIRRWGSPTDVEATKLRFRSGDIIFGRRRVYQRKLGVAQFDGICSAHAMVLRAKPDVVLPEFLPFFMQSSLFMDRAKEISVGSLSPTINWNTLAKERFSLPPLAAQGRIASVLAAADTASEELKQLRDALTDLRRASLIAYFDRLMTNDRVRKVPIGEAGEVLMGRQRSPEHEMGPSMRSYLRVANVFDGYIDTSDIKRMNFSDREYHQFRLQYGDVLLNEGQSRELVGRSAIFRDEAPEACFQNTLIRFRPSTRLTSEYAQRFFQYCLYTGRFAAAAKQTTSIAHLGVTRFAKMPIPLPDRHAQAEASKTPTAIERRLAETEARYSDVRNILRQLGSKGLLNQAGEAP